MNLSKLTLGTAQLGMKYGIANISRKPNLESSINILEYSITNGINVIDTSPVYGNSEEIIGSFLSSHMHNIKEPPIIISKLPEIRDKKKNDYEKIYLNIKYQILKSLKHLKIEMMPIYLIHHPSDILLRDGIVVKCLNQLKNEGFIERIGISIYNPEEVELALKFKELNVIQVPLNVFDNRLISLGLLEKLKKNKYLVFARSVYLQGLLFKSPKSLPNNLNFARDPLIKLNNIANEYRIEIARLALLYIRDISEVDSLVIGQETIDQVKENLRLIDQKPLSREIRKRLLEEFSDMPIKVINPSLWKK